MRPQEFRSNFGPPLLRPWICSLQSRDTKKANHRFFITVRELTWLQESMPRLPLSSRSSSVVADGSGGECLLRWRNLASRGPMPCKGTVRTAAKPTMISSLLGKTRTPIRRYSVKPKLNTRNSPPPHRSPLQHQGKSNRRGFHK
jgi:hypothetical protein